LINRLFLVCNRHEIFVAILHVFFAGNLVVTPLTVCSHPFI